MSKRPNGDGSIAPYGDGWRGRYTDPISHKQRAVYGKTQGECKNKLDAALSAIRGGVYVQPDKLLTGDWLDYWFENFYCIGTKQSTQATTAQGIRAHLKPVLGKYPLQKLQTEHIQAMIRNMQRDGLAPATIRRHVKTLNQALKQAAKMKKIRFNPTEDVKLPENVKPEIKYLTLEEQAALLRCLPDSTHGRAIRFLLGTGMRVSELCGLKWKDVKADGIHVERINMTIKDWREEGYTNVETLPKTTSGKRVIPAPPALLALLEEQRKAQMEECLRLGCPFDRVNGYIFANALGHPADRNNIARTFRAICKQAGIEGRGVHALRHTFATNWVQHSPDVPSLSRILGHTDPAFTYKTYCHADASSMAQGMTMIEAILQSAAECEPIAR